MDIDFYLVSDCCVVGIVFKEKLDDFNISVFFNF